MNFPVVFIAIFAALLAVATATDFVNDDGELVFSMGDPTWLGTGCPNGTVASIESTDGQTISLLFTAYRASTQPDDTRVRVSCNLAVNVDILPGFSVGIFKVDYRGNAYVPPNKRSYADLSVEYFFAGARSPVSTRRFGNGEEEFDDNFLVTDNVAAMVWSSCGGSTNFRINSSITAKKASLDAEDVEIAIDSKDIIIGGAQRFQLFYRFMRC